MSIEKALEITEFWWYTIYVKMYHVNVYVLTYIEGREDIMLALKETFKDIRNSKKVTQLEMADALGISKQNFSNKVQRNTFSPDELVKIADLLDMEIAFIDKDAVVQGEKIVIR